MVMSQNLKLIIYTDLQKNIHHVIKHAQLFQDVHSDKKTCLHDGQIYPPINFLLHLTASKKVFFAA